jgi:hypothetical protein
METSGGCMMAALAKRPLYKKGDAEAPPPVYALFMHR